MKKQYQDKFDEMQSKAVQILDQCYKENYDMCLLLIRWKHVLWGYRTPLELGDLGQCEDFMAHQAVQDLLDKVWFGGVEPFASLFKVCLIHKLCSIYNLVFSNLTSFVVKTSGLYLIPVDYNVLL